MIQRYGATGLKCKVESFPPSVKSCQPAVLPFHILLFYQRICIFTSEMKHILVIVLYWIAAILLTAFLVVSLDYTFWQGLMIGIMFLPCAMALSFFLPKVAREPAKERIKHSIYIIFGVMALALFLLIVSHMLFSYIKDEPIYKISQDIAPILGNPVFLAIILTVFAYGEFRLEKWLAGKKKHHPVSFTSDYRKVTVNAEDILYVESRDSEVWIYTRDGKSYRNKTGISQWENLLGPDFIRIHRSFLVNGKEVVQATPETVTVGGAQLPISRKYKESVHNLL